MLSFEILYEDDSGWIGRYKEPTTSQWILGVEISKWSLSEYKRYIKIFAEVLNKYPETYYSLVKGEKEKKFNMMFGFKETGIVLETTVGSREVLYVI